MKRIFALITVVVTIGALFPLHTQSSRSKSAPLTRQRYATPMSQSPQRPVARPTPWLQASTIVPSPELSPIIALRAISIPFGFETPLTLRDAGLDVLAKGHGGCAAGQIVTVDVEISQAASGALATAQTEAVCTGELQYWSATVAVDGTDRFGPGLARACGVATTRDGGEVTDTFEWCRDITLVVQTHLPLVMRE